MTTEATAPGAPLSAGQVPTFRHFIAGEWCDSTSGATFESRNPADSRDVIGRFQQGSAADVAMAVGAAWAARPMWQRTPAPRRGEILYAFGALMAQHKERLARAMTRGRFRARQRSSRGSGFVPGSTSWKPTPSPSSQHSDSGRSCSSTERST